MTNCFEKCQMSKFKKGVTPRKKIESKFPVDMHIYMVCPLQLQSFTKFCQTVSEELRLQSVSVVSFILVKFLSE